MLNFLASGLMFHLAGFPVIGVVRTLGVLEIVSYAKRKSRGPARKGGLLLLWSPRSQARGRPTGG